MGLKDDLSGVADGEFGDALDQLLLGVLRDRWMCDEMVADDATEDHDEAPTASSTSELGDSQEPVETLEHSQPAPAACAVVHEADCPPQGNALGSGGEGNGTRRSNGGGFAAPWWSAVDRSGATSVRIRSYEWEDLAEQWKDFSTSIRLGHSHTAKPQSPVSERSVSDLIAHHNTLLKDKRLGWNAEYELEELLGYGGQGVVFLTHARGSDGFSVPAALKVFDPVNYDNAEHYDRAMQRIAPVVATVAAIRSPNLLDIHTFEQSDGIRFMLMELIDGFDLKRLLVPEMLLWLRLRLDEESWRVLNDVVVTAGPERPRLQPGLAVDVIRACLLALAEMHARNIVHGDIKPSNIMLTRCGYPKIIDVGSAFEVGDTPARRYTLTWDYAAPEVHEGHGCQMQSDLASLGYVLIELLSGRSLFANCETKEELLKVKKSLPSQLLDFIPSPARFSHCLISFCHRLIDPDLKRRFSSAEEAHLDPVCGACAFLHELFVGKLGAVWSWEIHRLIDALR